MATWLKLTQVVDLSKDARRCHSYTPRVQRYMYGRPLLSDDERPRMLRRFPDPGSHTAPPTYTPAAYGPVQEIAASTSQSNPILAAQALLRTPRKVRMIAARRQTAVAAGVMLANGAELRGDEHQPQTRI
jgi:hypothetical protein